MVMQVWGILSQAHRQGVVHRDVRFANFALQRARMVNILLWSVGYQQICISWAVL